VARMMPGLTMKGDPAELSAVVEGIETALQRGGETFTGDITQKVQQTLGMIMGAAAAARIANMPEVSRNIVGGAAKTNADFEQSVEFMAALSAGAEDPHGDLAQTAGINVVAQMREELARAGLKDLSQSRDLFQMRDFVTSDDARAKEIRARLLGVLQEKSQAEIDAMISSGEMEGLTDAEMQGKLRTRAKTETALREFLTPGGQTQFDKFLGEAREQVKAGSEASDLFRWKQIEKDLSPILRTQQEEFSRQGEKDRLDYMDLRIAGGSRQKDIELAQTETDTLRKGAIGTASAFLDKWTVAAMVPIMNAMASTEAEQRGITAYGVRSLETTAAGGAGTIGTQYARLAALPVSWPLEVAEAVGNALSGQTAVQQKQLEELGNIRQRIELNNASKIIAPRPAPAPAPPTPAPLP